MDVTLDGDRCTACGAVFFPALRWGCERCGAAALEPAVLDAAGTLLTYATVRLADPPYTIGEIALDAGPVVRARLLPPDGAGLRFDARVHGVRTDEDVCFAQEADDRA